MNKKYYNIDKITEMNADYNLIYGERSGGKSWQTKHKKGVKKYLKTKRRFILLRRWKDEITNEKVKNYFKDVDIDGLTDGKYNFIDCYMKKIYLANVDENFKVTRGEIIGYAMALSQEQNFAGGVYTDVDDIIFEEFIARTPYLKNEPSKLLNLFCTVDRKEGRVKLWLLGNTISKIIPYFEEWDLTHLIKKQKQGEIISVEHNTMIENGEMITIKIACEFCEEVGRSSRTIGKHSSMLNTGSFQTEPQPLLPKSYNDYDCLFRIIFQYQSFKFCSEYIKDKKNRETCWFIYPYDKVINNKTIVFSDKIKTSKYWQRDIYNPLIENNNLKELFQTFKESNIFYASDSCGTDFKQVIDFSIRK